MSNPAKRATAKFRDKFLKYVLADLDLLKSEVENIKNLQETTLSETNQTLYDNHNQTLASIRNSGVMQVSETEVLTKIFTGAKIYLDPKDISVTPHLALDSIWESDITTAWLALIKPTDTIFDIGANFGYFGVIAAQKTETKKSKVILFEANPHLIPYINKTLSVNWLNQQSTVENLAVADQEGQLSFNIMKDYIGSSSLHSDEHTDKYMHNKMHIETEEVVTVDAVTLDAYCKNNNIDQVNLIKMDIEGYEDKAYQGMREIVAASPEISLFIEFTKDSYDDPEGFYDMLLADFGNVYSITKDGRIIRPKKIDYHSIIGHADDWVMPIFSKNNKLAS